MKLTSNHPHSLKPQSKITSPSQKCGRGTLSDNEQPSFAKALENSTQNVDSYTPDSSESGIQALIRLGASSRADNINLNGEWRDIVYQLADMNHDGVLKRNELQESVVSGGGTIKAANDLYTLLDRHAPADSKGGSITVDVFKQNLATSSNSFEKVLSQIVDTHGNGKADISEWAELLDVLRNAGTDLSKTYKSKLP